MKLEAGVQHHIVGVSETQVLHCIVELVNIEVHEIIEGLNAVIDVQCDAILTRCKELFMVLCLLVVCFDIISCCRHVE